jgi:hypothetical protein
MKVRLPAMRPLSLEAADDESLILRMQRWKKRKEQPKMNRVGSISRKVISFFQMAVLAIAICHHEIICRNIVNANGNAIAFVDAFGSRPNLVAHKNNMYAATTNHGLYFNSRNADSSCGKTSTTRLVIISSSPSAKASSCTLHASPRDDDNNDGTNTEDIKQQFALAIKKRILEAALPSLTLVWWPLFAAMGIPALVSFARSFTPNSSEQFAAVTVLIVANRIYLYALGLTIVATTAVRGTFAGDRKELGQRLTLLTEELLVIDKPLTVAVEMEAGAERDETSGITQASAIKNQIQIIEPPPVAPSFVKKMLDDSGLEENLDGVDSGTQALVLPVLVAGLLAISVVSLPIWSSLSEGFLDFSSPKDASLDAEWISQLKAALSNVLPFLSQSWNAILLTLFVRAEFSRLGYELFGIGGPSTSNQTESESERGEITTTVPKANVQIAAECLLAVTVTGYGAYYLQYWPAQNFVNSAIAVLVARAIRLNTFNAVVGALALLAIYDGASVLLIPSAANAATEASVHLVGVNGASACTYDIDSAITMASTSTSASASASMSLAASNPASSAMGSVAMQKLTAGGFQPGLLVTKLDNKLTGTLGLGDAVFPSILSSFLKRFDEDCNRQGDTSHGDGDGDGDNSNKSQLFEASLGGYVVGCMACEIAPTIATRGVPALVFILPLMGLATVLAAVEAGRFEELRRYNNDNEMIDSKTI